MNSRRSSAAGDYTKHVGLLLPDIRTFEKKIERIGSQQKRPAMGIAKAAGESDFSIVVASIPNHSSSEGHGYDPKRAGQLDDGGDLQRAGAVLHRRANHR